MEADAWTITLLAILVDSIAISIHNPSIRSFQVSLILLHKSSHRGGFSWNHFLHIQAFRLQQKICDATLVISAMAFTIQCHRPRVRGRVCCIVCGICQTSRFNPATDPMKEQTEDWRHLGNMPVDIIAGCCCLKMKWIFIISSDCRSTHH